MTTDKKVARRKLSLPEPASDLGADGLVDRLPGARGPHPNRVAAEIETAILDQALAHPRHGPMRSPTSSSCAASRSLRGACAASGSHGLLTKHDRLLRLKKATAERVGP